MKGTTFILLLTLLSTSVLKAQEAEPTVKKATDLDNTVFIQIDQVIPGISYERRFIKTSKFFLVGRVGLMGAFNPQEMFLQAIPLSLDWSWEEDGILSSRD